MAANYVLIEKITVGEVNPFTVRFTNIPQTGYTDLIVKASCRSTATSNAFIGLRLLPNNSSSNGSTRWVRGSGSTASSDFDTTAIYSGESDTDGATASTFTNVEWYIPNYTSSNYKSFSIDSVQENNATAAYAHLIAGLWSVTSPISSIVLDLASGSFKQYSTATLYGIRKY